MITQINNKEDVLNFLHNHVCQACSGSAQSMKQGQEYINELENERNPKTPKEWGEIADMIVKAIK